MSQDQNVEFISGVGAASLITKQYHIMKQTSTGYTYCAGATVSDRPVGILYNAVDVTAIDKVAQIAISGNVKVKLGGAVTKGMHLCSHTDGSAIELGTSSIVSLYSIGVANETGVSGDVIEVTLNIQMIDVD